MVVKQRVYDIVRDTFKGQEIGYEQLPKSVGASININFRYIKGKRIDDIILRVDEKPTKFGEVKYLGRGETGDYFNIAIPFYKIYKLNKEDLFKELNNTLPQERDIADKKKVNAKRMSLKELSNTIISFIEAGREDVKEKMSQLDSEDSKGVKEDTRKSVGNGYEPEVEGTVGGEYYKIRGVKVGDLGGKGTLILGNNIAYYDFTGTSYKEESEIPIEKWDKIDSLNKKYGTLFSAKEGIEKYGYKG